MPSVFTIQGHRTGHDERDTRADRGLDGDGCKRVKNSKTGRSTLLCHTGKGPTGWTFKKDPSAGPSGRRGKRRRK